MAVLHGDLRRFPPSFSRAQVSVILRFCFVQARGAQCGLSPWLVFPFVGSALVPLVGSFVTASLLSPLNGFFVVAGGFSFPLVVRRSLFSISPRVFRFSKHQFTHAHFHFLIFLRAMHNPACLGWFFLRAVLELSLPCPDLTPLFEIVHFVAPSA